MTERALDRLNPNVLQAEYAVRGPIVDRAQELEEQGRKIIYCNIGNPQALQQKPLSYVRQILSLLEYPDLLNKPAVVSEFPRDIVARARMILQEHPHGTGAYTQSAGIPFVRRAVAEFIRKRDGIPADGNHIVLTDGASKGAQSVLLALLRRPTDGVMIPIPQYPLYSASLALYGGQMVGYYLDEERGWQPDLEVLEESFVRARKEGITPVALVVINPGNPTGAVLSKESVRMAISFAKKHNLALLADEVYQENVYAAGKQFYSFASVLHEMGEKDLWLFSIHSVSKGFLGECGHRGGYLEFRNIPEDVQQELVKLQAINLCANVDGQLATYLMVAPPMPGDESYETFVRERNAVMASLKRKAEILGEGIRQIPGMSISIPEGAMYAFVKFELPATTDMASLSMEELKTFEAQRDNAYCLSLLEETGICVVPGSGFGQKNGTLHFRTTFLPPEEEIFSMVANLKTFHQRYVRKLEKILVPVRE